MTTTILHKQVVAFIFCFGAGIICNLYAEPGATISFSPNSASPATIEMSSGKARLLYRRGEAPRQAMCLITPSGREIAMTDLFLYRLRCSNEDPFRDALWTKPECWDSALSFKSLDGNESHPGGKILSIKGLRGTLAKHIYATIYPQETQVYVVNTLKAEETSKKVTDIQIAIFGAKEGEETFLTEITGDDMPLEPSKTYGAKKYVAAYLPAFDATIAVICLPRGAQSSRIMRFVQYFPFERQRSFRICGIENSDLNGGEEIRLRYIIYWNDGDRTKEIKSLADRCDRGELTDRFWRLNEN